MTGALPGVRARLADVVSKIAAAAVEAGRDPSGVRLVAVTKRVGLDSIREAAAAGQRDFGENYVQEGLVKMEALSMPELRWHLIGALQSNKAARAARAFHLIHSVSTPSVARAISREMVAGNRSVRVLLQVKLGGGAPRAGVEVEEGEAAARMITGMPGLELDGLMGVAPPGEDARPHFERLAGLLEDLRRLRLPNAPLRELSAGMSGDYRDAIAAGATIVRIGSAIFGERT